MKRFIQFFFFQSSLLFSVVTHAADVNLTNDSVTQIKPYQMSIYDARIQAFYQDPRMQTHDIQKRLDSVSAAFLGEPYILGNLGEGPTARIDQDPQYRTDEFDCLTYVSTVLAIIEGNDFKSFQDNVVKVNYLTDKPRFESRNHFTSVDWNPKNEANGYMKDITRELFPHHYKISVALINRPAWFRKLPLSSIKLLNVPSREEQQKLLNELHQIGSRTTVIESRLPYIPLTALYDEKGEPIQTAFAKIPNAVIIEIVRENWDLRELIGTHLNISHLGFGLRKKGVLIFREASTLQHKVIDISLSDYLKPYLQSETIKGIHVEQVLGHFARK